MGRKSKTKRCCRNCLFGAYAKVGTRCIYADCYVTTTNSTNNCEKFKEKKWTSGTK